jgi:hypothetical protein
MDPGSGGGNVASSLSLDDRDAASEHETMAAKREPERKPVGTRGPASDLRFRMGWLGTASGTVPSYDRLRVRNADADEDDDDEAADDDDDDDDDDDETVPAMNGLPSTPDVDASPQMDMRPLRIAFTSLSSLTIIWGSEKQQQQQQTVTRMR